MDKTKQVEEIATGVTKKLADEGKLIEAGFAAFAHFVIPKNAPLVQYTEMRLAYMAGAEHTFASIMNMLDPGEDPTTADLRRMDLIAQELDVWRSKLAERMPTKGSA
jgi:hypothetical protein